MSALTPESVTAQMAHVEAALFVAREVDGACELAALGNNDSALLELEKRRAALHALVARLVDDMTAWVLHRCDCFADAEGGVRVEHVGASVQWAVWLNVNKNPRLKVVEFPAIGVHIDIQKQLALAPIAICAEVLTGRGV